MMKRTIFFLLLLHVVTFASFFEEEDPTYYHHVNVITGHLDLSFTDLELKSPIPFKITRNYTSAGALERTPDDLDKILKDIRNSEWMLQGGWGVLPYTNLLVLTGAAGLNPSKAYLSETTSSNLIPYSCYKTKKSWTYLRPSRKKHRVSGNLNSRKNKKHSRLKIRKNLAILFLPDGTERHYSGNIYNPESYWLLELEILPSKHRIVYFYTRKNFEKANLSQIQLQNPQGTKIFATIDFELSEDQSTVLHAKTSDQQCFSYQLGTKFKNRDYFNGANTNVRPKEIIHYQPGRKGIGARLGGLSFGDQEQFRVEYYQTGNIEIDKVKSLKFPDPEHGEFREIAQFTYSQDYTEIKDHEGNTTRYMHDQEKLLSIEYYNSSGHLHSKTQFCWKDDILLGKKCYNGDGTLLFSKSFYYDDAGNIIKETWKDHITNCPPIIRNFIYSKHRLLHFERQSSGLAHRYEYLPNTDLLTKKFTLDRNKIFMREFLFYNEDNFLIRTIIDDGTEESFDDLTNVSERHCKQFDLDPDTGLCIAMTESYLDTKIDSEQIFLKHYYTYNERREIIAETVYLANGQNYTTYYTYNTFGHLIKETSPLGRENISSYDHQGNLISSKEIGSPEKKFQYDFANRPIKCTELGKTTRSTYDIKGRLLKQTDKYDNNIKQEYDCFGRCIKTFLPETLDSNGNRYIPCAECHYDTQGNIVKSINSRGETTTKNYNILRKPTCVEYPDGSKLQHFYNSSGNIVKTVYANLTEVHFTYDIFQRVTSKSIFAAEGKVLSEETWTYNAFHLLSYTDPMGLTTYYRYDGLGRKIQQQAEDRIITYSYDAFGNLEKTKQGGTSYIQLHNVEGEITEQWEEDLAEKKENHMVFFYDHEGRKEKAIRITSKGEAEDLFFYDDEGRLCKHTDPLGESTQFIYSQITNSLGQEVEQKTTIDPLGNILFETYDANHRLVSSEKKDSNDQTVAYEQFFYDKAGNKAKRLTTVYENSTPIRTHTTRWKHNERGWPIEEIEEEDKCTLFKYDTQGQLIEKILPSGTSIFQSYDGLGRLLELKSSDKTVHYAYTYRRGAHPIQAENKKQHLIWKRTYNLHGEMISENYPDGSIAHWNYDNQGRRREYILPDRSSISYSYTDLHLSSITRYSSHQEPQYIHTYLQFDENGHVAEEELILDLGVVSTTHDLLERIETFHTPWHIASIEYGPSGLVTKTGNSLFQTKEYQYDPLNQLLREGDQEYFFDSLGNPLDAQINSLNQITSDSNCRLIYDKNGNPIRRYSSDQIIHYKYDALNRLTTIHIPEKKHIEYSYDPFSRLYSKTTYTNQNSIFSEYDHWSRDVTYFLYDQETEIGSFNEQKKLRELKVIGLGILGEIGAAIAIERNCETFAPLHDFSGNIIALISTQKELIETCDIDAFGKTTLSSSSINPWRFHSKRMEEHLIFFGERFYDPSIGRWLTTDPAGTIESANLYLYVLNNPLNRLDLFGLYSEDFHTEVPISYFINNSSSFILCTAYYDDIQADWLLVSNQFHKLQFTPEELQTGKIDILDHFQDLFSNDSAGIGLITFQNGIKNEFHEFEKTAHVLSEKIPGDGLQIFMYTPTKGLIEDVSNTFIEKTRKKDTPEVIITRQAMIAFSETLGKISRELLWQHTCHSRAGAIGCAAIDGMSGDEMEKIQQNLLWFGIAPAEPLAKKKARDTINVYSKVDRVTGSFGKKFARKQRFLSEEEKPYKVKFLSPASIINKCGFLPEHGIMCSTYQKALDEQFDISKINEFYQAKR